MRNSHLTLSGVTAAALLLGCKDSTTSRGASRPEITGPNFTASSGFTGTTLARGNVGAFHIHSKANRFDVEIKVKDNADIAVSDIVVGVGGHSGWHSHPGPVLVVVKSGTITFYHASDPNCSPEVHPAGTAFVETGGDVGMARNEGAGPAEVIATFFVEPFRASTRIDQPNPGNCPF